MTTKLQELFNMAYKGLESQGWYKSKEADGRCLYRGPNRLKCAVGHCIPDKDYKEVFDDRMTGLLYIMKDVGIEAKYAEFLSSLQRGHDGSISPKDMKRRVIRVAQDYGLEVPA